MELLDYIDSQIQAARRMQKESHLVQYWTGYIASLEVIADACKRDVVHYDRPVQPTGDFDKLLGSLSDPNDWQVDDMQGKEWRDGVLKKALELGYTQEEFNSMRNPQIVMFDESGPKLVDLPMADRFIYSKTVTG